MVNQIFKNGSFPIRAQKRSSVLRKKKMAVSWGDAEMADSAAVRTAVMVMANRLATYSANKAVKRSRVSGGKSDGLDEGPIVTLVNWARCLWKRSAGKQGIDQAPVRCVPPTGFVVGILHDGMIRPRCEVQAIIHEKFEPK